MKRLELPGSRCGRVAERRSPPRGADDVLDDEPVGPRRISGEPRLKGDHRRSRRHGLDRDRDRTAQPVSRQREAERAAQEIRLLVIADLADEFDAQARGIGSLSFMPMPGRRAQIEGGGLAASLDVKSGSADSMNCSSADIGWGRPGCRRAPTMNISATLASPWSVRRAIRRAADLLRQEGVKRARPGGLLRGPVRHRGSDRKGAAGRPNRTTDERSPLREQEAWQSASRGKKVTGGLPGTPSAIST